MRTLAYIRLLALLTEQARWAPPGRARELLALALEILDHAERRNP